MRSIPTYVTVIRGLFFIRDDYELFITTDLNNIDYLRCLFNFSDGVVQTL
jgi:hypothetical protein